MCATALMSQPCVVLPWVFQGKADLEKPFWSRWWVKANIWIWVYGFIGNYFWTHYFYQVILILSSYSGRLLLTHYFYSWCG